MLKDLFLFIVCLMLRIEPRFSHRPGKCSTTEPHPTPSSSFLPSHLRTVSEGSTHRLSSPDLALGTDQNQGDIKAPNFWVVNHILSKLWHLPHAHGWCHMMALDSEICEGSTGWDGGHSQITASL